AQLFDVSATAPTSTLQPHWVSQRIIISKCPAGCPRCSPADISCACRALRLGNRQIPQHGRRPFKGSEAINQTVDVLISVVVADDDLVTLGWQSLIQQGRQTLHQHPCPSPGGDDYRNAGTLLNMHDQPFMAWPTYRSGNPELLQGGRGCCLVAHSGHHHFVQVREILDQKLQRRCHHCLRGHAIEASIGSLWTDTAVAISARYITVEQSMSNLPWCMLGVGQRIEVNHRRLQG